MNYLKKKEQTVEALYHNITISAISLIEFKNSSSISFSNLDLEDAEESFEFSFGCNI